MARCEKSFKNFANFPYFVNNLYVISCYADAKHNDMDDPIFAVLCGVNTISICHVLCVLWDACFFSFRSNFLIRSIVA